MSLHLPCKRMPSSPACVCVCVCVQEHVGAVEDDKAAEAQAKSAAQAAAQHSAEAAKKKLDRERAARAREWNAEEVRMLEKAMVRYPQGTAKRWEQVRDNPALHVRFASCVVFTDSHAPMQGNPRVALWHFATSVR